MVEDGICFCRCWLRVEVSHSRSSSESSNIDDFGLKCDGKGTGSEVFGVAKAVAAGLAFFG